MSGVQLKVLPQFPAQVTGIAPIVVTKSGLSYQISYNPLVGTLSTTQIKQQLVAIGQFNAILALIPADPSDAVNQAWRQGGITQLAGPLLMFIFTTLGYNAAQQAAFVAAAVLLPY